MLLLDLQRLLAWLSGRSLCNADMKDEINLLPPETQKERVRWLYNRRFNRLYTVTIVGVLIIAGTYGGLYWFYQQSLNSLNSEIESAQTQDESVELEVREANRLLTGISERTEVESWTPLIDDLLAQVPAGVSITGIELRPANSRVANAQENGMLSGASQLRSSVVEYERALRTLSWVENVDAPLQNLASGPQVRFSFTITRKAVNPTVTPTPGGNL